MLKFLRIAVTALSLAACVLLCVLWVQSHQWRHEFFGIPYPNGTLAIVSKNGTLEFHPFSATANDIFGDRIDSLDDELYGYSNIPSTVGPTGVSSPSAVIPHGIALIIFSIAGIAPWLPKRYSLRTLLIATTLVAVGLGMVVYLVR
jgi:hypothetical protein